MHMFRRADDGVCRTGIRTKTTADALVRIGFCDLRGNVFAAFLIERKLLSA